MARKQRSDRIKDARREPNGQLSRAAQFAAARKNARADAAEWEAMSVAMQARHHLHGIAYPSADRKRPHVLDQRAGSVVGRLALQGEISMAQLDAATKYAEDVDNYRRAISAPKQLGAVEINGIIARGVDNAEREEFCRRAKRRYCGEDGKSGVLGAIRECQGSIANRGQNLHAALDYLVLRDEFHAQMIPWLRTALNCLSRHYGFVERTEAA